MWAIDIFAIVGCGLLFLVFSANQIGKLYGTTTWPVTYEVVEVLGGTFALFVLIVITFYAGDLVWRERDAQIHQVQDAMPVPNWVPLAAKFTALVLMVFVLQAVILLTGVLTQALKGYTNFELGLYATSLFGMQLTDYVLLAALAMLVHVLANHRYVATSSSCCSSCLEPSWVKLGLEHNLYQFGSDAGNTYSDMNRFGPFLRPFWWFKVYWGAWAVLFALFSNLLWVRGQETGAGWRFRLARRRIGRPELVGAAAAVALTLGIGGFIFYNTNILNRYRTSHDVERESVDYERQYETVPAPAAAANRGRAPRHRSVSDPKVT